MLKIKIIIINMNGKINSYCFEKKMNVLSLILFFFFQKKILYAEISLIYHGFSPDVVICNSAKSI